MSSGERARPPRPPAAPLRRVAPFALAMALGLSSITAGGDAFADEPTDEGMAQSLFDAGRALMDQGKPEEACPKFEESNKLDPSAGTLLNLGKCQEALGRTASAWASYKKAITVGKSTGQSRHVTAAEEFIAAIEPKLSKLTVSIESHAPGLVVRRIDLRPGSPPIAIPDAASGVAVAVDPGDYRVEAEAPGFTPWSATVSIAREADQQTVTVPELAPKPVEKHEDKPPPLAPKAALGPLRIASFVTGGAGVVLLGVGATLGGLTLADASTAESDPTLCPNKRCTKKGEEFVESARSKGYASTATIVVGGAAVAASVTLFVLSLHENEPKQQKKTGPGISFVPLLPAPGAPPVFGAIMGGRL